MIPVAEVSGDSSTAVHPSAGISASIPTTVTNLDPDPPMVFTPTNDIAVPSTAAIKTDEPYLTDYSSDGSPPRSGRIATFPPAASAGGPPLQSDQTAPSLSTAVIAFAGSLNLIPSDQAAPSLSTAAIASDSGLTSAPSDQTAASLSTATVAFDSSLTSTQSDQALPPPSTAAIAFGSSLTSAQCDQTGPSPSTAAIAFDSSLTSAQSDQAGPSVDSGPTAILHEREAQIGMECEVFHAKLDHDPMMTVGNDEVSLHPSPNDSLVMDTPNASTRCVLCHDPDCVGSCTELPCQETLKDVEQVPTLIGTTLVVGVGGVGAGKTVDDGVKTVVSGHAAGGAHQAAHESGGVPVLGGVEGAGVSVGVEGSGGDNSEVRRVLEKGDVSSSRERVFSGGSVSGCSSQSRMSQERVGHGGDSRSGDEVSAKRKREGDAASDGGWNWNCREKTNSVTMLMGRARISLAQQLVFMEHFMNCPRACFNFVEEAKESVKPSTVSREHIAREVKNKQKYSKRHGSGSGRKK